MYVAEQVDNLFQSNVSPSTFRLFWYNHWFMVTNEAANEHDVVVC